MSGDEDGEDDDEDLDMMNAGDDADGNEGVTLFEALVQDGEDDPDDDFSDDEQDVDDADVHDDDVEPAADNVFQDDLGNFEEAETNDRALPGNAIDALEADIAYPDEEEEYADGDEEVIDFDPRMVFGGQPAAHLTFEQTGGEHLSSYRV